MKKIIEIINKKNSTTNHTDEGKNKFIMKIIEKKIKNLWYYLIKYVSILIISKIMNNYLILNSNGNSNDFNLMIVVTILWGTYMCYLHDILGISKMEKQKKVEALFSETEMANENPEKTIELLDEIKIIDKTITKQQNEFNEELYTQGVLWIALYGCIYLWKMIAGNR